MKKLVTLMIAIAVLASITSFAAAEEPVTITWLIGNAVTVNEDNMVRDAFKEKLGITVDAIWVSSADYTQKMNTLIAAKTLPDLFGASLADAEQFKEEGMIVDLTELLQEYGPNILVNVGDSIYSSPLNKDGGIYGIIGANTSYYQDLLIRTDWLKTLNLEMPTDFDSLYDVLYAFTYGDPDQNGENDTFGFVFSMNNLKQLSVFFGAYHIAVDSYYQLEDGTVTTYMKAPDYLKVVKYLNKLYHAGIINPDFLALPNMSCHSYLWTGRVGTYGFQATGPVNNWYPGRYAFEVPADPADMFAALTIKGDTGLLGTPKQYPNVLNYYVISSTCEHPEAVVKFIDYLYSEEGEQLAYLGIKDVMWDWADEEHTAIKRLGEFTDDALHRANGGYAYWIEGAIVENTEYKLLRKLTRDIQAKDREIAFDYPLLLSTLDAEVEYAAALKEITNEALAQLITSDGDIEAEYAQYVERWNNAGGLQLEQEATAAYAAQ